MRNTTKLKHMLLKYTFTLDMDEDDFFKLVLTDKQTNHMQLIEGKSYSEVLSKGYSYFLKELKKEK